MDWDGLALSCTGTGDSVLWLHGYTMSAEVWAPLWHLLPEWRHLGLDMPWHGSSRDLRPDESLADLADSVVAHATAAGVSHVVGLSFGTVLAAEMAIRHPTAFASWTLAAPALAGMPHESNVAQRYRDLASLYARRGAGPHMTDLWLSVPPRIFEGIAKRPAALAALRSVVGRHQWRELEGDAMRRLVMNRQRPEQLGAVRFPVVVIVGEHELFTHRACAISIVGATPRGVLEVLEGCGHLAPLESPQATATVLASHLRAALTR